MGYFAGWELIDGEWNLSGPGIGPEGDWMFSIADTFLFLIQIAPEEGKAATYFFGTNPVLVYDLTLRKFQYMTWKSSSISLASGIRSGRKQLKNSSKPTPACLLTPKTSINHHKKLTPNWALLGVLRLESLHRKR